MTGSPATLVLGSQKLVGSQPPSACTKTYSLPWWSAAFANGTRKPIAQAPVAPARLLRKVLRFIVVEVSARSYR